MEEILDDLELPTKVISVENKEKKVTKQKKVKKVIEEDNDELVSCLRNEKIIVRYIPKMGGLWANTTNPRHVLSGGMADTSFKTYVVPRLASSGVYVNVLTNKEKEFLESYMGLEDGDLSVYNRHNNFWDSGNPQGINKVTLYKRDNYFDLSIADDYIKYKILLANKNFICPSLKELEDRPKATYQFVIIEEGAEAKKLSGNVSATMQCYKEFGKMEDDNDTMRVVIELLTMRPLDVNTKSEFLKNKINELIQANPKTFLNIVTDEYLSSKVLIKKSIEAGNIYLKGNYHYLTENNIPLCSNNEEPTLNNAARFLNLPKNQTIKLMLEGKLKED